MDCTMQSLSDDEQRQVLSEVLTDKLDAILEYVQEIPDVKHRLGTLETKVDKIDSRLIVVEAIIQEHDTELKSIKTIGTYTFTASRAWQQVAHNSYWKVWMIKINRGQHMRVICQSAT